MIDSLLNMETEITSIYKSAYFQLNNVVAIRQYLTKDVAVQLIYSFVTRRTVHVHVRWYEDFSIQIMISPEWAY